MTTSGLDPWLPALGDIFDDALELAGIDPASASQRHLSSALRSMQMVYSWLSNRGEALYREEIEIANVGLGGNDPTFFTPFGTIDIKHAMVRNIGSTDDSDVEIISKRDWLNITNKSQTGRPQQMFVNFAVPIAQVAGELTEIEKILPVEPTNPGYGDGGYGDGDYETPIAEGAAYTPDKGPQCVLWPVPDREYQIIYYRVRASQRAATLGQNLDARAIWTNVITLKLAHLLALKFNPKNGGNLRAEAEDAFRDARLNNREMSDTRLSTVSFAPTRSGRRYR